MITGIPMLARMALVLRVDSSALPMRVMPDGRVPDREGRDILSEIDPGPDYHPVLRHPSPH